MIQGTHYYSAGLDALGFKVQIITEIGSVTFYPADPNDLYPTPPENALDFKILKQTIYQQCFRYWNYKVWATNCQYCKRIIKHFFI